MQQGRGEDYVAAAVSAMSGVMVVMVSQPQWRAELLHAYTILQLSHTV